MSRFLRSLKQSLREQGVWITADEARQVDSIFTRIVVLAQQSNVDVDLMNRFHKYVQEIKR